MGHGVKNGKKSNNHDRLIQLLPFFASGDMGEFAILRTLCHLWMLQVFQQEEPLYPSAGVISRRAPLVESKGPVFELKMNITDSEFIIVADSSQTDSSTVILRSTTVIAYRYSALKAGNSFILDWGFNLWQEMTYLRTYIAAFRRSKNWSQDSLSLSRCYTRRNTCNHGQ